MNKDRNRIGKPCTINWDCYSGDEKEGYLFPINTMSATDGVFIDSPPMWKANKAVICTLVHYGDIKGREAWCLCPPDGTRFGKIYETKKQGLSALRRYMEKEFPQSTLEEAPPNPNGELK